MHFAQVTRNTENAAADVRLELSPAGPTETAVDREEPPRPQYGLDAIIAYSPY